MNNSRRQFMTRLGGGALATALLNAPPWSRNVFAQTADKKAVFIYHPDGCAPSIWHPTQTGTNFSLPQQTSPLDPVKQHCVFLDGMAMPGEPGGHQGMPEILTANNDFSIDYLLADAYGGRFPFKSIHLGVAANFQGNGRLSMQPGGVQVAADDNPINAFEGIFGAPGGSVEQQRDASILALAKTEVSRLRSQLGSAERAKLDQHEQAIIEVEQRLNDTTADACNTSGWNSGGFSIPPGRPYPPFIHRNENFDTVAKLQIDLIVLALKCGMTPVATLVLSHPVSPFTKPGLNEGNHNASHNGNNPSSPLGQTFTEYKRYYCELLRYLIEQLNGTTDTDGAPMLQNTLVFLGSELGNSDAHDHKRMPFVLAGNAGGALTTGRALSYPTTHHSKLLVSIANMFDINIDSFGDMSSGVGGLSGL